MLSFKTKSGLTVNLIGDPHLGKVFETGVPMRRRGEREQSVWRQFEKELREPSDFTVIVGDVFEHAYVGYDTVIRAAELILGVASEHDGEILIMAGNHDLPRSLTSVGAFHALEKMLARARWNVQVMRTPTVVAGLALFPWQWGRTAIDQVKKLGKGNVDAAIGHWDTFAFNGNDDHLVPVVALAEAYGDIPLYTGHQHTPGDYTVAGKTVHCTGSMQPYAHDQDPNGAIYLTLTPEQAEARDDLRDKFVRILLPRGEEMPDIDCLALTHITDVELDFEEIQNSEHMFNWQGVLRGKISELDPKVQDFINDRLQTDDAA